MLDGAAISRLPCKSRRKEYIAIFRGDRNLDATTYPATSETPYKQNQYGLFVGGPVIKNHTFFSGYWEGFRSEQTQSYLAATLTDAMRNGDFSAVLGTTPIGTDDLGRPEYEMRSTIRIPRPSIQRIQPKSFEIRMRTTPFRQNRSIQQLWPFSASTILRRI